MKTNHAAHAHAVPIRLLSGVIQAGMSARDHLERLGAAPEARRKPYPHITGPHSQENHEPPSEVGFIPATNQSTSA